MIYLVYENFDNPYSVSDLWKTNEKRVKINSPLGIFCRNWISEVLNNGKQFFKWRAPNNNKATSSAISLAFLQILSGEPLHLWLMFPLPHILLAWFEFCAHSVILLSCFSGTSSLWSWRTSWVEKIVTLQMDHIACIVSLYESRVFLFLYSSAYICFWVMCMKEHMWLCASYTLWSKFVRCLGRIRLCQNHILNRNIYFPVLMPCFTFTYVSFIPVNSPIWESWLLEELDLLALT